VPVTTSSMIKLLQENSLNNCVFYTMMATILTFLVNYPHKLLLVEEFIYYQWIKTSKLLSISL